MDEDNGENKPEYDEEKFKCSLKDARGDKCRACREYLAEFSHYEGLAKRQFKRVEDLRNAYQKNDENDAEQEKLLAQKREEEEILDLIFKAQYRSVYSIGQSQYDVISEREQTIEMLETAGCDPRAMEIMEEHSKRCISCLKKIIDAGITSFGYRMEIKHAYDVVIEDIRRAEESRKK
jgi:hypothetical protein